MMDNGWYIFIPFHFMIMISKHFTVKGETHLTTTNAYNPTERCTAAILCQNDHHTSAEVGREGII